MPDPPSEDPVTRLVDLAHRLVAGHPADADGEELLDGLEALGPRELVRFDWRSRGSLNELSPQGIARLRRPLLRGSRRRAWEVLGLMSADGRERERTVKGTRPRPLTARLLALRCTDWADPVRAAALERLASWPATALVEALALADQLAAERVRGDALHDLLEERLSEDELRAAIGSADARVRRAAWRRLTARAAASFEDLRDAAARDADPVVRALGSSVLEALPPDQRRELAEVFVADPVGSVATPALAALVALEGSPPVVRALTGPSMAVRGAARGWAAIRGIDARSVYRSRLGEDPRGRDVLLALAELADARDAALFAWMLGDERPRIRAAGLRALARVDEPAARTAALDAVREGTPGRMNRAASDVLRERPLGEGEKAVVTAVALDGTRPARQRLRALSLLRSDRWRHLAVLLEARDDTTDHGLRHALDEDVRQWTAATGRIGRAPAPADRERIDRLLGTLPADERRTVEFVLRTVRS